MVGIQKILVVFTELCLHILPSYSMFLTISFFLHVLFYYNLLLVIFILLIHDFHRETKILVSLKIQSLVCGIKTLYTCSDT